VPPALSSNPLPLMLLLLFMVRPAVMIGPAVEGETKPVARVADLMAKSIAKRDCMLIV